MRWLLFLFHRCAASACTRSTNTSISGAPYNLRPVTSADTTALCAVHDPSLVSENDVLYVFSTDAGRPPSPPYLAIRRSLDGGSTWSTHGSVFPTLPAWVPQRVPMVGGLWAPDASYLNDRWLLYYAASSFGSDVSAIGLATSPSLAAPTWEDRGAVLTSSAAVPYNAIDPSLAVDPGTKQPWLVFGSFWGGIYIVRIDASTGLVDAGNNTVVHLAQRAPPDALEGAFLAARPDGFYLFASWDYCCRGAASNYSVRVGRSAGIAGPYMDKSGLPMLRGGGTHLVGGGHGWAAGGGPGFLRDTLDSRFSTMVLHGYDGLSGDPFLQLVTVAWGADGWPAVVA